jgi:hypothetical protein
MITTLHVAQRNLFETEASQVLPPICRLTSTIGSSHIISKPETAPLPAAAGRWVPQPPLDAGCPSRRWTLGAPGPSHLGTWDCPGTLPPHSPRPPRTLHITTLRVPQVPRTWGPRIAQAPYLPTPRALHGLCTSQHCGCPRPPHLGTWDCPGTLPPHSPPPPRTLHITTLWVPQVPRIWGPGIAQAPYLPTPFALHGLCAFNQGTAASRRNPSAGRG